MRRAGVLRLTSKPPRHKLNKTNMYIYNYLYSPNYKTLYFFSIYVASTIYVDIYIFKCLVNTMNIEKENVL